MAVKRKKEVTDSAFIPYLEVVEVNHPVDGILEIELPRLTTGRMAHISKSLSKLINAVSEHSPEGVSSVFSGEKSDEDDTTLGMKIIKMLPQIFPIVLDEVIDLMSLYLDEPREWVEELSTEDLAKIFAPFLKSILANLNQLLGMIGLSNIINIRAGEAQETTLTPETQAEVIPITESQTTETTQEPSTSEN